MSGAASAQTGVAAMPEKRDRFLQPPRLRLADHGDRQCDPDSFSDGGRFQTSAAAVAQARRLAEEGRRHHRHRRPIDAARAPAGAGGCRTGAARAASRHVVDSVARGSRSIRRKRPSRASRRRKGSPSSMTSGGCSAIRRWRMSWRRTRRASSSCITGRRPIPPRHHQ